MKIAKVEEKPRTLLVFADKNFTVKIPPKAKVTFGPWSPPNARSQYSGNTVGTLRIYQGTKTNIIACYPNVWGFQDIEMEYQLLSEQCEKDANANHKLLQAAGQRYCWSCGDRLFTK